MVELRSTTQINQFAMFFIGRATIYDLDQPICNVFFIGRATIYHQDKPICNVFSLARLRSTTQINQFSMCCQWWLNYDLWPRSTNFLCVLSGWATIYDPDQPIRYVFSLAELRSTTQIKQFAMFFQWLSYDLRPRSTNSLCFIIELRSTTLINQFAMVFSVNKLRSTTQIYQFSMFCHWLSYDLRPRSTN